MKKRLIISAIMALALGFDEAGFATEIDPEHIGDTLTGTNHVTYSSTDEAGTSTGHVDVTNQTVYYTYIKPYDYNITDQRLDNILADSVNKKVFQNISSTSEGGAIYNATNKSGVNIISDFIGNSVPFNPVSSIIYEPNGGAIVNNAFSNASSIGSITGDFINNIASNGGAISNVPGYQDDRTARIGSITGDFINNRAYYAGGAIQNGAANGWHGGAIIESISGNFIGNSAKEGGAIYGAISKNDNGGINSIVANFIGNVAENGGAIYAASYGNNVQETIMNIQDSIFIGNTATINGGAIFTEGILRLTAKDNDIYFYNNKSGSSYNDIYFVASYIEPKLYLNAASGHKITFNGTITSRDIGSIYVNNGDIIGGEYIFNNHNDKTSLWIYNGAYLKFGSVVQADGTKTYGQIFDYLIVQDNNGGTVDAINSNIDDFEPGSYITLGSKPVDLKIDIDLSDALNPLADNIITKYNNSEGTFNIKELNFISGTLQDIIDRELKIQILKNNSANNNLKLTIDDSIKSQTTPKVISETERIDIDNVAENTAWTDSATGTKIKTTVKGTLDVATTTTTDDSIGVKVTSVETDEGTVTVDTLKAVNQSTTTRNFNATVDGETYTATDDLGKAGAGTININGMPTGGESQGTIDLDGHKGFELDKATTLNLNDVVVKNPSAVTGVINETSTDAVVNLSNSKIDGNVTNAGEMNLENSQITGIISNTGTLNLNEGAQLGSAVTGTGGTTNINNDFTLENSITGNDVTLNNGAELTMSTTGSIAGANSFTVNSGSVNLQNGVTTNTDLGNVTLNDNMNLKIDGDFASELIDTITVKSINANGNNIVIADVNILTPTTKEEFNISPIGTTQEETSKQALADAIRYEAGDLAMTPIYKYHVDYNPEDAMLKFTRYGGGGGDDFNPAVLAEPVVAQAGIQATMNSTINYAFQQADSFSKMPLAERTAIINANKYAAAAGKDVNSFSSTDFNENLQIAANQYQNNAGIWVKPYTSFEKINLSGGPNVDTITYGTLVGFDTDFKELKHGWDSVFTGYVGYNGAHLSYNGVSSTLNGGVLGATETFYKGNFWTALTATVGASVADIDTMYGHENSTSLLAGVASKTGYNFEFKGGKIILQPIWTMSYSMINTFDYKNAAGVKIESDPLHTIQLNPSIRLIGNLKNGWQPYASVGMVWNLMNQTHITANGTSLPNMHIRPYVQYGVGLQKSVGERFTGYGQVMLHNGGRNGVALTAGFRWALGKGSNPKAAKEKTSKTEIKNDKVTIKQTGEKHVLKEAKVRQIQKISFINER